MKGDQERLSDGRSRLRAAREGLGWPQSRAAAELAALAARRGYEAASPASLKTQLSRWENQHVLPDEAYRALLSELYGCTESELGLAGAPGTAEPGEADELRSDLASADGLDAAGIDLLEAQLAATNALDHRLGSAAVADSLGAQLSHLERLFVHALDRGVRRRLSGLVGSAALLAGRVQADRARPATAWRLLDRARQAGQDADDGYLTCWALVEQASILVEIGRHRAAVRVLDAAGRHRPAAAGPLFGAWMSAHLGSALAAGGQAEQAHTAYRAAEAALDRTTPSTSLQADTSRPAGIHVEFDQAAFLRQRGHGLRTLRDDARAIPDLRHGLAGGPARDLAAAHVDLACAFGATGDASSAASYARTARELTRRIGSKRLAARLESAAPPATAPISGS